MALNSIRFWCFLVVVGLAGFLSAGGVDAFAMSEQANDAKQDRTGYLVRIPLPITSKVSQSVKRVLKQLVERSPHKVIPDERAVVVLEFDTSDGRTGLGSDLEACQSLARYLISSDMDRLQSVAYIPADRGLVGIEVKGLRGQLNGHAVLVAIAANHLALDPGTAIGNAGADEKVDSLVSGVYFAIAERRLRLPVPVVMSMLERQRQLFRVTIGGVKVTYVDGTELSVLEQSGEEIETTTICKQGDLTLLTGEQLLEYRLVNLGPTSRTELARLLGLVPGSLDGDAVEGKIWKAIQLELPTFVDQKSVQWIVRSLGQQVNSGANLIVINIDSNEGEPEACFQLARHLAEYDSNEIRTVAFVRDQAKGPIGMLALACSHLIMTPDSVLGGRDELDAEASLPESKLDEMRPLVEALATQKQTDWSVMMAMLDPGLTVSRYQNIQSKQIRLWCLEELSLAGNVEDWEAIGQLGVSSGIGAVEAERLGLARMLAENMEQIQTFYQLESPPESIQPSSTDRWIERLASYLASPIVATWLLFGAMFFFSTEMSAPGVGLPGFLATICVVLFFWSQNLDGNADWLEIILFVVGAIFVLMEIFLLPGLGVFGIGGFVMVVTSIILASQTFLIPKTTEQIIQVPYSVMPVLGAGLGLITAAVLLRHVMPKSPFLRRLMLVPRPAIETGFGEMVDPEAIVDWSHLAGQSGKTVTRLHPSGKARIAGRVYDVISNGPMIAKGAAVLVIEARGNRIVVKSDGEIKD